MSVTKKNIDISKEELTKQQWASKTKGIFMNMLSGVFYNPQDGKYHMPPIQYSDCSLEGEKIKFANGQELIVIFSCLAEEFEHKQEVKDQWWAKAREVKESYLKQKQIEEHVASNDVDLKKLRKQGALEVDDASK